MNTRLGGAQVAGQVARRADRHATRHRERFGAHKPKVDPVEPLVVSLNARAQQRYRSFWAGPVGTAALLVPGVIVSVAGLVLWLTRAQGAGHFFAAVVVFSGLYATYAGWDHRRRAVAEQAADPLAFVIAEDGVAFPRGKKFDWDEVRFVLTDESRPRLLVTPGGAAYLLDDLDRGPGEIAAALAEASGGRVPLERR